MCYQLETFFNILLLYSQEYNNNTRFFTMRVIKKLLAQDMIRKVRE